MNKIKNLLDTSLLVDQCSQQLSTAQVKKEQASRPSKRGCFLTETELRLSRYILIFSFCGYWQSFFAWSHQHKHASLSRKGFMWKIFGSWKREGFLGSRSPGIERFLYMGLQIRIAAFHSTLQFSMAGIYQILGFSSCGRKTSSTKSIQVQDSFQESPTGGWAKVENCNVVFYWPSHKLNTVWATAFNLSHLTCYSWKIKQSILGEF